MANIVSAASAAGRLARQWCTPASNASMSVPRSSRYGVAVVGCGPRRGDRRQHRVAPGIRRAAKLPLLARPLRARAGAHEQRAEREVPHQSVRAHRLLDRQTRVAQRRVDLLDRVEHRRRHHPAARQDLRDPGVLREAVVDRRPEHQHRALRVPRARGIHEPGREAVYRAPSAARPCCPRSGRAPSRTRRARSRAGASSAPRRPRRRAGGSPCRARLRDRSSAADPEADGPPSRAPVRDRRSARDLWADPPPGDRFDELLSGRPCGHLLYMYINHHGTRNPHTRNRQDLLPRDPRSRRRTLVALLSRRVRLGAAQPRRRRDRIRRRGQGGERLVGDRPAAVGRAGDHGPHHGRRPRRSAHGRPRRRRRGAERQTRRPASAWATFATRPAT